MNRRLIAAAGFTAAALCGCGHAPRPSTPPVTHPGATESPAATQSPSEVQAAKIAAKSIQCATPTSKQVRRRGAPSGRCAGVTVEFGQPGDAPNGWQVANAAKGHELAYATVHGSLYLDARCSANCSNVRIDHWNVVIDMTTDQVVDGGTAGQPLS